MTGAKPTPAQLRVLRLLAAGEPHTSGPRAGLSGVVKALVARGWAEWDKLPAGPTSWTWRLSITEAGREVAK